MQPITLVAVQKSVPAPGDFGAVVKGTTLEVPQDVLDCVTHRKINTASELVDTIQAAGPSFRRGLNWNVPELEKALEKLTQQLTGLVDDVVLNPQRAPRPLGAWNPKNNP